jgi:hypothetical protein
LIARECKVKDVEVLGDAIRLGRLPDRGPALLQVPPQHHLSGRLAVLARDVQEGRIIEAALLTTTVRGDTATFFGMFTGATTGG